MKQLILELLSVEKNVRGEHVPFGKLRYRYTDQLEWTEIPVSISPILMSRMFGKGRAKDRLYPSNYYVGQQYVAPRKVENMEDTRRNRIIAYNECPFELNVFQPAKSSNIPMNARLEAIDETASKLIFDELSDHFLGYEKVYRSIKTWCRHRMIATEAIMTDKLFGKIRPIEGHVKVYSIYDK